MCKEELIRPTDESKCIATVRGAIATDSFANLPPGGHADERERERVAAATALALVTAATGTQPVDIPVVPERAPRIPHEELFRQVEATFEDFWGDDSFSVYRYSEMFSCVRCCAGDGYACAGDCCKCGYPSTECYSNECSCCMYAKAFLTLPEYDMEEIIKQF